jgi:hypothetical protein
MYFDMKNYIKSTRNHTAHINRGGRGKGETKKVP